MERAEETGAAASFERKLSDTLTINVERAPKMLPLNLKQGKIRKKKKEKKKQLFSLAYIFFPFAILPKNMFEMVNWLIIVGGI